jgi:acyl carrier protein
MAKSIASSSTAVRRTVSLDVTFAAPETKTEKALSQIWSEVLGLDRFGIHDDLFDLGGDSLMVTRIINRVFQSLGLEVPIKAIFDAPTVAGMAMLIEQYQAKLPSDEVKNGLLSEIDPMRGRRRIVDPARTKARP